MAIVIRRNPNGEIRYRVFVWWKNKLHSSKTFKRKQNAEAWKRDQLNQLEAGEVGKCVGNHMTLREFIEDHYWPSTQIGEATKKDRNYVLKKRVLPRFGSRMIAEICEREWAQFFNSLREELSNARVNRIHTMLSAIYSLAIKLVICNSNPLKAVPWYKEDVKARDYWSIDEAQIFLSRLYQTKNERFAFYHTAYETGLRLSELIGLQRDCVKLDQGLIEVRRTYCKHTYRLQESTKSGLRRFVPVSESLKTTLRKHLASHLSEFVFIQKSGRPYSTTYLRRAFPKDQELAKVHKITLHGVRHTYASHFVMRGGPLYDLQKLLGHSNVKTTERYAHLSALHLRGNSQLVRFDPNHFLTIQPKMA